MATDISGGILLKAVSVLPHTGEFSAKTILGQPSFGYFHIFMIFDFHFIVNKFCVKRFSGQHQDELSLEAGDLVKHLDGGEDDDDDHPNCIHRHDDG